MRLFDLCVAKQLSGGGSSETFNVKAKYKNNDALSVANLLELEIGEGITSISQSAYSGCTSLTRLVIPNSVTSIGTSAFYNCRSLSDLTLGNNVTTIRNGAFYNCRSLSNITLGNKVTTIGNSAFEVCLALETLKLSKSVTNIGPLAFADSEKLKILDLTEFDGSAVPTLGNGAISNFASDCKFLFSSQTALDAFAANSGWSRYSGIFEVVT